MTSTQLETTLEKISRVITEKYGLQVVFRGGECKTDGQTIYLPSLPETMGEGVLPAIRGWADHECAHAIFTETEIAPEWFQDAISMYTHFTRRRLCLHSKRWPKPHPV